MVWPQTLPSYTPLQSRHGSDRKSKSAKRKKGNGNPRLNCVSSQHELVCVLDDMLADDVLCCNPPSLLCLCPSRSGIGLGRRGNGANGDASTAF